VGFNSAFKGFKFQLLTTVKGF